MQWPRLKSIPRCWPTIWLSVDNVMELSVPMFWMATVFQHDCSDGKSTLDNIFKVLPSGSAGIYIDHESIVDESWARNMSTNPLKSSSYFMPATGRICVSHIPPTFAVFGIPAPWQLSPRSLTLQITSSGLPEDSQEGVVR
jgi:hypothetical protein